MLTRNASPNQRLPRPSLTVPNFQRLLGRPTPRSAPATCTRGSSLAMKPCSVSTMTTDEEAEAFLGQDLSDLDFAAFKPLTWEA